MAEIPCLWRVFNRAWPCVGGCAATGLTGANCAQLRARGLRDPALGIPARAGFSGAPLVKRRRSRADASGLGGGPIRLLLIAALALAVETGVPAAAQQLYGPPGAVASGATVWRSEAARAADVLNGKDFGMKCDGSTDDTAALQAAVTAAEALAPGGGGGVLQLPPGGCIVNGTIAVTAGVSVRGAGNPGFASPDASGTWIIQEADADVFQVETKSGVSFRDMGIAGYNAYELGGAPNSAGACISLNGSAGGGVNNYNAESRIDNLTCSGMYDGLRLDEAANLRVSSFHAIGFAHDGILKIDSQNPDSGQDSYSGLELWAFGTTGSGTEAANPFAVTSGSNVVTVTHDTTGLVPGMIMVWNGGAAIVVNGTTVSGYNAIQSIVDATHLTIDGSGNASATGSGGGTPSYWYGPFASFEYRAGGDIAVTGSKLNGGCFGFVDNATYGQTGDMRLAADSFENSECAGVAAIQATANVLHGALLVAGNEFLTVPGPIDGEFYIGEGTPAGWLTNVTVTGNTIGDPLAAGSDIDVTDGKGVAIAGNELTDTASGGHAIAISGNATHVLEYANEAVGFSSGKYGTVQASSIYGTAPAISACGTSPAVSGDDIRGTVTIGSGTVTACTVTFASAYGTAPVVMLTGIGAGASVLSLSAVSPSAFTIAASASIGGQKVEYRVMQ